MIDEKAIRTFFQSEETDARGSDTLFMEMSTEEIKNTFVPPDMRRSYGWINCVISIVMYTIKNTYRKLRGVLEARERKSKLFRQRRFFQHAFQWI